MHAHVHKRMHVHPKCSDVSEIHDCQGLSIIHCMFREVCVPFTLHVHLVAAMPGLLHKDLKQLFEAPIP